ncbi:thymidine kinase [Bacillus wiedmannii]|uniref:thymidine kinase n=1 Tax=Bacillus wiedmannii TaxID=1890302 RepID=UPI000BF1F8C5|nr:thymidine kinase [Bacillus wiedmannii]PEN61590.1 thymidine kinase [Bacillus wiedmannii]PHA62836.1 thymidine kinase [Bacillus wiedmannii]
MEKQTFTTGLMGAGKSKELIEKYDSDQSKKIALAANLTEETGTEGKIESRNGRKVKAIYLNKDQSKEVLEVVRKFIFMKNIDTIYVDEVQFFPKDIVSEISNLAKENQVKVNFFGLETTFTAEYFEAAELLLKIIPEQDIIKISMGCQADGCTNTAEYNARIVDGKVARDGDTFISQKSKYLALCKKCYFS